MPSKWMRKVYVSSEGGSGPKSNARALQSEGKTPKVIHKALSVALKQLECLAEVWENPFTCCIMCLWMGR